MIWILVSVRCPALTRACGKHECRDSKGGNSVRRAGSHRTQRTGTRGRPEPAAGGSRAIPRSGAADRSRCRLRQNPRADPPHRLDLEPVRRMAEPDSSHHLHQQGRRRNARKTRLADRPGGPAHVGLHLPLRLRAHSEARRQVHRTQVRLLHL